jgi:hypothetical protein
MVHNLLSRPARMFSRGLAVPLLPLALILGACGSPTAPADASSGKPTLAAIRSEIFNGSCALDSCHARPTLAAKLDLRDDGLCSLLVKHTSCLFPNKFLVLPYKPEASFLLDKLRGTNLDGTPDPACATTNMQMPFGQAPLSSSKIAQIEAWIQAGADCGNDPLIDAGIDAPVDAGEMLANVASITAAATTISVGQHTQVTVTLTGGAPASGELVYLDLFDVENTNVLSVPYPNQQVSAGVSSATFDVVGVTAGVGGITGNAGTNSMSLTIMVTP